MKLHRRRFLRLTAAGIAAPAFSHLALAEDYPARPVRVIAGFGAGGGVDITARLIGQWLNEKLGQSFVVENRTGAGGNIGVSAVAHAKPDGSTFLFTNTGHAVNRALYAKLDYDPAKDLTPVTIVAEGPMVLLVPNSSPDKTLAEFVARVRAKPGEYSYGSTGTGGALQLVSLLLTKAAGLKMEEVPYRGSAPAAQDLVAGRMEMLYDAGVTGFPLATSG